MSKLEEIWVCECCKGEFTKAWTDEQRSAEYRRNFGLDERPSDAVVCTECYKKILGQAAERN